MKKLYGTLLTSGNKDEFEDIRKQLNKRKVIWNEFHFNGSVIFYFNENQLKKLPIDKQEGSKIDQYLPVEEESGHSIYRIEKMLNHYKKQYELE